MREIIHPSHLVLPRKRMCWVLTVLKSTQRTLEFPADYKFTRTHTSLHTTNTQMFKGTLFQGGVWTSILPELSLWVDDFIFWASKRNNELKKFSFSLGVSQGDVVGPWSTYPGGRRNDYSNRCIRQSQQVHIYGVYIFLNPPPPSHFKISSWGKNHIELLSMFICLYVWS